MEAISSTTGDEIIRSSTMQKLDSPSRASHPFGPVSDGGVKLFGVRLTNTHAGSLMMMRKTVSMGNLSSYNNTSSSPPHAATHPSTSEHSESGEGLGPTDPLGYVSDGLVQNSGSLRERKKGVPWTEEEHRMFLAGLQKLGKGDWRGIARNFVPSRTPTQVASHAQKYFLRQSNLNKRKRRSSLFDMISSSPVSSTVIKSDRAGSLVTELNLASPTISAELRLGRPEETHRGQQSSPQRWRHQFSSQQQAPNIVGTQGPRISQKSDLFPLTLSFSPPSSFTESNIVQPSTATGSFTSSAAFSSSSSSSSLSSLGRIDESPELLASLALSIGPPLLLEPSAELTLKLEQPTSARHSAIGGSTNSSSRITNAIRVV